MEIKFETLSEVKNFILYSDITFWAKKVEPWGGIGMIITDVMPEEDLPHSATFSVNSAVYTDRRGEIIIVTPYVHELSWLTGTFMQMSYRSQLIPQFTHYMKDAFTAFLILQKEKEYCSKEMLVSVVDFMDNIISTTNGNGVKNDRK